MQEKKRLFIIITGIIYKIQKKIFRTKNDLPPIINRILISNWASLGDVLLASSVIQPIKKQFPHCKIGFIVSKNSREVIESISHVDWIHELNSPFESKNSMTRKLICMIKFHLYTNKTIYKQIKKINYDCAFELFQGFPNTIPILWKAKIPNIIGFKSCPYNFLLNKSLDASFENKYLPRQYEKILECIGIRYPIKFDFIPMDLNLQKPYILFHPCSSEKRKELPLDFWRSLASFCEENNILFYICGKGERQNKFIKSIIDNNKYLLIDKLSWQELCAAIKNSIGIITVDSVPVHIAAAMKVPFIALYNTYEKKWLPDVTNSYLMGVDSDLNLENVKNIINTWTKDISYVS